VRCSRAAPHDGGHRSRGTGPQPPEREVVPGRATRWRLWAGTCPPRWVASAPGRAADGAKSPPPFLIVRGELERQAPVHRVGRTPFSLCHRTGVGNSSSTTAARSCTSTLRLIPPIQKSRECAKDLLSKVLQICCSGILCWRRRAPHCVWGVPY